MVLGSGGSTQTVRPEDTGKSVYTFLSLSLTSVDPSMTDFPLLHSGRGPFDRFFNPVFVTKSRF